MGSEQSKKKQIQKEESKTSQPNVQQPITEQPVPQESQKPQQTPLTSTKNPYPEVKDYLSELIVQQPQPKNLYPKVPVYLTSDVLLEISKLKEILRNVEKSNKQSISHIESKLIEVHEKQSSIITQQQIYQQQINSGFSQIIEEPKPNLIRQNQFYESIKQVIQHAFYCQGIINVLTEQSKEHLVYLNKLILSINMNSILLQYIEYYQDQQLMQNAQKLFQQFLNSYQFHEIIQFYLRQVTTQLNEEYKQIIDLIQVSNIFEVEDEQEESLIDVYEKIKTLFNSKNGVMNLQDLLDLQKFITFGEQQGEKILKEKEIDNFINNKVGRDEGSQRFSQLLKQFITIIEYKHQNWEDALLDIIKLTQDKSKLLSLLYEFSKLQIESSLSYVYFCINKLQNQIGIDKSNAQLQRVVNKLNK